MVAPRDVKRHNRRIENRLRWMGIAVKLNTADETLAELKAHLKLVDKFIKKAGPKEAGTLLHNRATVLAAILRVQQDRERLNPPIDPAAEAEAKAEFDRLERESEE